MLLFQGLQACLHLLQLLAAALAMPVCADV